VSLLKTANRSNQTLHRDILLAGYAKVRKAYPPKNQHADGVLEGERTSVGFPPRQEVTLKRLRVRALRLLYRSPGRETCMHKARHAMGNCANNLGQHKSYDIYGGITFLR